MRAATEDYMMQEARLHRTSRQLSDCGEVTRSPPRCFLSLFGRGKLKAYGLTRSPLSDNRQVGFGDDGDLWIATNGRRISHQDDRMAVPRNLNRTRTGGLGWQ